MVYPLPSLPLRWCRNSLRDPPHANTSQWGGPLPLPAGGFFDDVDGVALLFDDFFQDFVGSTSEKRGIDPGAALLFDDTMRRPELVHPSDINTAEKRD